MVARVIIPGVRKNAELCHRRVRSRSCIVSQPSHPAPQVFQYPLSALWPQQDLLELFTLILTKGPQLDNRTIEANGQRSARITGQGCPCRRFPRSITTLLAVVWCRIRGAPQWRPFPRFPSCTLRTSLRRHRSTVLPSLLGGRSCVWEQGGALSDIETRGVGSGIPTCKTRTHGTTKHKTKMQMDVYV